MTVAEDLAAFAATRGWDDLSVSARDALKLRVLDAVACAVGAIGGGPPLLVADHVADFGGTAHCTLVGGGRTAPDRAALLNGTLVRYLDFNDSYLTSGETCHPSDSLAAVLAAAECAERSGRELLIALAVAYQVQCRLSDVAPVRARGFDHTAQLAFAVAAGVSRALGLDPGATAHAVAIAGTALTGLRVTRTGTLSHWKGLAAPFIAAAAVDATFLAGRGVTGPLEVFEGIKGFMDTVAGPFALDWGSESLDAVTRTAVKRYNAEIHSQSTIEAVLELRDQHGLDAMQIQEVEVDTFQVAYDIIGGGEEGDKTVVETKEQADHSLPYLVAVALLDGQVLPDQFEPQRVTANDVQALARRVTVRPADDLSARFPVDHPCRVRVHLRDGRVLASDKTDYEGWPSRPLSWDRVVAKFDLLAAPYASDRLRADVVACVADLDGVAVTDLTALLARVSHDIPSRSHYRTG